MYDITVFFIGGASFRVIAYDYGIMSFRTAIYLQDNASPSIYLYNDNIDKIFVNDKIYRNRGGCLACSDDIDDWNI